MILNKYLENYKNFPREIWIITIVSFINRAGTMVVPFLSKYMKESLGFSYSQVGWIMVCFGVGSLVGTFISGKLADKFGAYKVMIFSLFVSGFIFMGLQFVTDFEMLCFSIFMLTTIADMFRPAMMVTMNNYLTKKNRVKALALVRSASNVGFVFGPLLGGLLIAVSDYNSLFVIDGLTCIVSILIFAYFVKEKQTLYKLKFKHLETNNWAPLQDKPFLIHWVITMISAVLFFQIFTVLPIYHKVQFGLNEFESGLILSFYGLLLFLFELPVVSYVENRKFKKTLVILAGLVCIGLSFLLLAIIDSMFVLIFATFLMGIGGMLTFPFASAFVSDRSFKSKEGIFMSIFQMSYGFAHVFSAKTALSIVDVYGFRANWIFNVGLAFIAVLLSWYLYKVVEITIRKTKENIVNSLFKAS
nr:MFS transporter [uncultured Flavobacterium sp.]